MTYHRVRLIVAVYTHTTVAARDRAQSLTDTAPLRQAKRILPRESLAKPRTVFLSSNA